MIVATHQGHSLILCHPNTDEQPVPENGNPNALSPWQYISSRHQLESSVTSICWICPSTMVSSPSRHDLVAIGYESGRLEIQSLPSLEVLIGRETSHRSAITCLQMDCQALRLASGHRDGYVAVWHATTLQLECWIRLDQSIASLDFSKDSCFLQVTTVSGKALICT